VPVYIALPRGTNSEYLALPSRSRHVDVGWGDLRVGLQGAPTIVLVDDSGMARRIWVGGLSDAQGRALLTTIQGL
jgi:hypothetical protein